MKKLLSIITALLVLPHVYAEPELKDASIRIRCGVAHLGSVSASPIFEALERISAETGRPLTVELARNNESLFFVMHSSEWLQSASGCWTAAPVVHILSEATLPQRIRIGDDFASLEALSQWLSDYSEWHFLKPMCRAGRRLNLFGSPKEIEAENPVRVDEFV